MSSALKVKSKGITKKTRRASRRKTPQMIDNFRNSLSPNTPNINSLVERFKKLELKKSGPWIVASELSSLGRDGLLRNAYQFLIGQFGPFRASAVFAGEQERLDIAVERYTLGKQERLADDVILSVAHGLLMTPKRYFTVPNDTIVIFMTYPDFILWDSLEWKKFINPLYTRRGLDELFLGGKLEKTLMDYRTNLNHIQIDIRIPGDACENLELGYQDPKFHLGIFTLPFKNVRTSMDVSGIGNFVLRPGVTNWANESNYRELNAVKRTLAGLVKTYSGKIIFVNSCRKRYEPRSL
jgi:hypothetical protein